MFLFLLQIVNSQRPNRSNVVTKIKSIIFARSAECCSKTDTLKISIVVNVNIINSCFFIPYIFYTLKNQPIGKNVKKKTTLYKFTCREKPPILGVTDWKNAFFIFTCSGKPPIYGFTDWKKLLFRFWVNMKTDMTKKRSPEKRAIGKRSRKKNVF